MNISVKPKFCVYGVLKDGTGEKFRFEYIDRRDANKKVQELRNILAGARYNVNYGAKYKTIIVKEETGDEAS